MAEQLLESYAFEPEYTPEELEALDREQNDGCRHQREQERRGEPDERLRRLDWCSCSNCSLMPTRKECLCCKEMELLEPFITNLDLTCFITHVDFAAVCLDKSVLKTSLAALKEFKNRVQRVDIPNQNDIPNR